MSTIVKNLRILHLEGDGNDAELIRSHLKAVKGQHEYLLVNNEKDFTAALKKNNIGLVLADYSLPQFDGMAALSITREIHPDIPFIIVSETVGEETAAELIKKGATDYILKDNLSRLAASVSRAVKESDEHQKRKEIERELIESELRYRQFFRDSPMPMWIYDLDTLKFVDVNDAAVSQYGYSKEEFLSMTIKDIRSPDEIPGLMQNLSHREQSLQHSGIWRHKKKDRTIIDVEITSHSLKRKHHQNLRLVLANDVTERLKAQSLIKESLREKEILLKEIHHRVKNNLQVITSLLKLQSQHVRDPGLLYIIKETQNRIMAMSFAHQKLYQSKNFSDVDFSEYLGKIVHQITHVFGTESKNIKITMNSESVKLGIETAIPCGMLVNEVITNSVKHAFPNNEKGEIKVSFKKTDGDYYRLTIGDNGIGMSDEINIAEAKTLGLQLIETLAKQINAKLELRRNNGIEYHITFKPITYKKRV